MAIINIARAQPLMPAYNPIKFIYDSSTITYKVSNISLISTKVVQLIR